MYNQSAEHWFCELQRIWIEKDLKAIPTLLSESFQYYESPFDLPLTTLEEVQNEWEAIKHQNIKSLEIKLLGSEGNNGMAVYHFINEQTDGTLAESRGVYWVELDKSGKATLFRQWWMNK